jgi:hypothetical protein
VRRLLLACLLAAVPAVPAAAAPAACVATNALPVCAGTCLAGETISVRVVGNATGTVSCGGTTTSCLAFRATCTASGIAASSGPLTCTVSGGTGVAYCDAKINATAALVL